MIRKLHIRKLHIRKRSSKEMVKSYGFRQTRKSHGIYNFSQ